MKLAFSILGSILLVIPAWTSLSAQEPPGPIARLGTTPTIDGVFEEGEWDDAEIVRSDSRVLFRLKHDGVNLYLAIPANGGDLILNLDSGLEILHWSAQLGSAEYRSSDTTVQTLVHPFDYELWGLAEKPPEVIRATVQRYLAEQGWVANLATMGTLMQSEMAISFEMLGVTHGSDRFAEIPGLRISAGLLLARGDPRTPEIMAMPREEAERLYPAVSWPTTWGSMDEIHAGALPDTVRVDPAAFRKIWIELRR